MRDENEPIAIVGIGCRFPGGVADPSSLWHKLIQGFDAVAEIPNDRWSTSTFYDAELGRPMKSCSKWAALLPDVDQFDAGFFGISDAEAEVIDPQQRLLLETAWEAMEDAGYVPNPDGERTGVFVGISTHDYEVLQGSILHLNEASPYSSTGLAGSIAANRISYCFNFSLLSRICGYILARVGSPSHETTRIRCLAGSGSRTLFWWSVSPCR